MAGKNVDTNVTSLAEGQQFIDVDLSAVAKKKIRFNGDDSMVIELNTSDMTIIDRMETAIKQLNDLAADAGNVSVESLQDEDGIEDLVKSLDEIDTKMRGIVDYIFDAKVSEVCANDGSMYDVFDGMFRYEHIINALTKIYENNMNLEYKKMQSRVSKHTSKYTK